MIMNKIKQNKIRWSSTTTAFTTPADHDLNCCILFRILHYTIRSLFSNFPPICLSASWQYPHTTTTTISTTSMILQTDVSAISFSYKSWEYWSPRTTASDANQCKKKMPLQINPPTSSSPSYDSAVLYCRFKLQSKKLPFLDQELFSSRCVYFYEDAHPSYAHIVLTTPNVTDKLDLELLI